MSSHMPWEKLLFLHILSLGKLWFGNKPEGVHSSDFLWYQVPRPHPAPMHWGLLVIRRCASRLLPPRATLQALSLHPCLWFSHRPHETGVCLPLLQKRILTHRRLVQQVQGHSGSKRQSQKQQRGEDNFWKPKTVRVDGGRKKVLGHDLSSWSHTTWNAKITKNP